MARRPGRKGRNRQRSWFRHLPAGTPAASGPGGKEQAMECDTETWRAALRGAAVGLAVLVVLVLAGPVALAILDGVRLAVGARDAPNILG